MQNLKTKINLLLIILIAGIFLAGIVHADLARLEDQVRGVLNDYIVLHYPELADKKIQISFRSGDSNLKKISKWGLVKECEILDLYSNFKPMGRVALPIRFTDNKGRKQIGLITAKIEIFDSVVVAKTSKKKGEPIFSEDLEVEERDVSQLAGKYFVDPLLLENVVATAVINRGVVLQPWMTRPTPLIAKGEDVNIVFASPHILVTAPGKVLEDAYLNRKVKVRRNGQKKVFDALVVGSREVEVII